MELYRSKSNMIKQVGDKHNFEDWKFGMNCKYDGREPDFWRNKTDSQKHDMWEKYMRNECFEE